MRPGQVERPLEAEDPLAAAAPGPGPSRRPRARPAPGPAQVEPGDRLGGQDAPVVMGQWVVAVRGRLAPASTRPERTSGLRRPAPIRSRPI